jgi:hypothetical protein
MKSKLKRDWRGALLSVLLMTGIGTINSATSQTSFSVPSAQTDTEIPPQFRSLYEELDDTIRNDSSLYPFKKGASGPLLAPSLFMAGSGFGPAASDSQRWKDLLDTLDAYKAAGMNAVSVMIAAPDLTLGDPGPLIDFYQRLIRAIHSRDMKLYVEHFDNPPFSPHAYRDLQDTPQGRKDFLNMREKELRLIYGEIKPDYLSMVTEPQTMIRWSRLSISADQLADWIAEVTARLKSTKVSPNTLLGAGAGIWESDDFALKLSQQKNLDYVDIHFYPLKLNGEDMVAKLVARIHKVTHASPKMRVTIGETWLYKHGASEPKGMLDREAFFRDNFSFWSPLDQRYLSLLIGIAQKENISVVAPYFSQYFFAYYTFGDMESRKLPPWPGSVLDSWNKALESIRTHKLSPTGKAISSLLRESRK